MNKKRENYFFITNIFVLDKCRQLCKVEINVCLHCIIVQVSFVLLNYKGSKEIYSFELKFSFFSEEICNVLPSTDED